MEDGAKLSIAAGRSEPLPQNTLNCQRQLLSRLSCEIDRRLFSNIYRVLDRFLCNEIPCARDMLDLHECMHEVWSAASSDFRQLHYRLIHLNNASLEHLRARPVSYVLRNLHESLIHAQIRTFMQCLSSGNLHDCAQNGNDAKHGAEAGARPGALRFDFPAATAVQPPRGADVCPPSPRSRPASPSHPSPTSRSHSPVEAPVRSTDAPPLWPQCLICMDRFVTHAGNPCGHMFCLECTLRLQVSPSAQRCPSCRADVLNFIKLHS
jgi:hypothetical protein